MNKLGKVAVAVVMVFSVGAAMTGFAGMKWETGSYSPADWQPVDGNVLAGVVPTFTGDHYTETGFTNGDEASLTDGALAVYPNGIFALKKDATLTWAMKRPVILDTLRVFSRWGNGGRDGIGIDKVEVKVVGAADFVNLGVPPVSYGLANNGTSGALFAHLSTDDGSALAENVMAVRLTFGNQDNSGSGYVEFEATGSLLPDFVVVAGSPAPIGQPQPGYGLVDKLTHGETYTFTCPETAADADGVVEYACTGWKLTRLDGGETVGTTTTAEIEVTDANVGATLTWQWEPVRYLKASTLRVKLDGTGTGMGSDWGNATASIADAVREAAANPFGGEIWVQKGLYTVTATIVLSNNVAIIGGFDGTETSADQADPEKNPTILTSVAKMNQKWTNGETMWTQDEDGAWVYHSPSTFAVIDRGDDHSAFSDAEGGSVNCRLEGLLFTQFGRCNVIAFTHGGSDGFVLRKCKLLGCNGSGNTSGSMVNVLEASATVDGCIFEGGTRELYLQGTEKNVLVTNCTFSCGRCMWYGTSFAGLGLYGSLTAEVKGCRFVRCESDAVSNINNGYGAVVYVRDSVVAAFSDCLFENCVTRGAVRGMFVGDSSQKLTVERCLFVGNRGIYADCNTRCCAGIAMGGSGALFLRDSYFGGNYMTNATTAKAGSCLCIDSGARHTILNCTFEHNTNVCSKANNRTSTLAGSAHKTAFVHCILNENVCYYSTDGETKVTTADCSLFANPYGGDSCAVINCIAYNSSPDYKLNYCETNPIRYALANDDFYNYTLQAKSGGDLGFRYQPILLIDPELEAFARTDGTVAARGVVPASPLRRKYGRPVWQAKDGELYFYDTTTTFAAKPWRRCNYLESAQALTDEQAAEIGLSLDAPLVPDAFGRPRTVGKIALGPYQPDPLGLQLLVK